MALDAFMTRNYRISLQPPLQEDLYCLELYASYLQSLAAAAATIGLVVLSGTFSRILTGLWCCHHYSGCCGLGHYALYVSYVQGFCAAAASVVFVL